MFTFTDTEDTIHPPTAEEDAAYAAEGAEIKADARALLATVRHLLTGAEIDMLEDAAGEDASIDMGMLDSLRIQFYAQICNFKNGRASA
jgi:hypothetical protein